jgi:hypothetical protein
MTLDDLDEIGGLEGAFYLDTKPNDGQLTLFRVAAFPR